MAVKKGIILVRLVSTAGTGYFLVKKRPTKANKLAFNKYDPIARKHVQFVEKKI
jgi:large subunit ribosomal protein L33